MYYDDLAHCSRCVNMIENMEHAEFIVRGLSGIKQDLKVSEKNGRH